MSDTIEMRIAGIPAIIEVTDYVQVRGSFAYDAPSADDYYGYEEMDYVICDRRGRPAPWLERKVTPEIRREIESAISRNYP